MLLSSAFVLGHVGDGNFHVVLLMTKDAEQVALNMSLAKRIAE